METALPRPSHEHPAASQSLSPILKRSQSIDVDNLEDGSAKRRSISPLPPSHRNDFFTTPYDAMPRPPIAKEPPKKVRKPPHNKFELIKQYQPGERHKRRDSSHKNIASESGNSNTNAHSYSPRGQVLHPNGVESSNTQHPAESHRRQGSGTIRPVDYATPKRMTAEGSRIELVRAIHFPISLDVGPPSSMDGPPNPPPVPPPNGPPKLGLNTSQAILHRPSEPNSSMSQTPMSPESPAHSRQKSRSQGDGEKTPGSGKPRQRQRSLLPKSASIQFEPSPFQHPESGQNMFVPVSPRAGPTGFTFQPPLGHPGYQSPVGPPPPPPHRGSLTSQYPPPPSSSHPPPPPPPHSQHHNMFLPPINDTSRNSPYGPPHNFPGLVHSHTMPAMPSHMHPFPHHPAHPPLPTQGSNPFSGDAPPPQFRRIDYGPPPPPPPPHAHADFRQMPNDPYRPSFVPPLERRSSLHRSTPFSGPPSTFMDETPSPTTGPNFMTAPGMMQMDRRDQPIIAPRSPSPLMHGNELNNRPVLGPPANILSDARTSSKSKGGVISPIKEIQLQPLGPPPPPTPKSKEENEKKHVPKPSPRGSFSNPPQSPLKSPGAAGMTSGKYDPVSPAPVLKRRRVALGASGGVKATDLSVPKQEAETRLGSENDKTLDMEPLLGLTRPRKRDKGKGSMLRTRQKEAEEMSGEEEDVVLDQINREIVEAEKREQDKVKDDKVPKAKKPLNRKKRAPPGEEEDDDVYPRPPATINKTRKKVEPEAVKEVLTVASQEEEESSTETQKRAPRGRKPKAPGPKLATKPKRRGRQPGGKKSALPSSTEVSDSGELMSGVEDETPQLIVNGKPIPPIRYHPPSFGSFQQKLIKSYERPKFTEADDLLNAERTILRIHERNHRRHLEPWRTWSKKPDLTDRGYLAEEHDLSKAKAPAKEKAEESLGNRSLWASEPKTSDATIEKGFRALDADDQAPTTPAVGTPRDEIPLSRLHEGMASGTGTGPVSTPNIHAAGSSASGPRINIRKRKPIDLNQYGREKIPRLSLQWTQPVQSGDPKAQYQQACEEEKERKVLLVQPAAPTPPKPEKPRGGYKRKNDLMGLARARAIRQEKLRRKREIDERFSMAAPSPEDRVDSEPERSDFSDNSSHSSEDPGSDSDDEMEIDEPEEFEAADQAQSSTLADKGDKFETAEFYAKWIPALFPEIYRLPEGKERHVVYTDASVFQKAVDLAIEIGDQNLLYAVIEHGNRQAEAIFEEDQALANYQVRRGWKTKEYAFAKKNVEAINAGFAEEEEKNTRKVRATRGNAAPRLEDLQSQETEMKRTRGTSSRNNASTGTGTGRRGRPARVRP